MVVSCDVCCTYSKGSSGGEYSNVLGKAPALFLGSAERGKLQLQGAEIFSFFTLALHQEEVCDLAMFSPRTLLSSYLRTPSKVLESTVSQSCSILFIAYPFSVWDPTMGGGWQDMGTLTFQLPGKLSGGEHFCMSPFFWMNCFKTLLSEMSEASPLKVLALTHSSFFKPQK